MYKLSVKLVLIVILLISACTPAGAPVGETPAKTGSVANPTRTAPSPAIEATPTETPIPFENLTVWIDPAVPAALRQEIQAIPETEDSASALLHLRLSAGKEDGVEWIYALVAPFSSLLDSMTFTDLQAIWQGAVDTPLSVLVEETTLLAMEPVLGQPSAHVKVLPAAELLRAAWNTPDTLAIVPFEELEPQWKVLALGGQSPIHNDFQPELYPLKTYFGWDGTPQALQALERGMDVGQVAQLAGNRDPSRMTVLVMTGVTALVRATAVRMEEKGMTYPGQDIRDWLVNADLTHISNEVSFSPECPDPNPSPGPLIFCSKPEYIALLDDVGTDILELTGNHGVDWGRDALIYSLGLYKERGWRVYAAGEDVYQAREAVTLEHNGNKFAFIGCNPVGPDFIWATETQPGVANCDYPWMWQRIRELTAEGYQVIATFQYFETYRHYVEPFEEEDFRSMADAGAVIVSGSQAHHPMAMEFYRGSFIHYGLGNLFFDQMHTGGLIPDATRKEFIDRYVFYNNRHISTELLTAMLEDYARPRPMTPAERADFLTEIFAVTRWGDVPQN